MLYCTGTDFSKLKLLTPYIGARHTRCMQIFKSKKCKPRCQACALIGDNKILKSKHVAVHRQKHEKVKSQLKFEVEGIQTSTCP